MYKLFLKQNGSTVLHGDYLDTNVNDEKIEINLCFLKTKYIWSTYYVLTIGIFMNNSIIWIDKWKNNRHTIFKRNTTYAFLLNAYMYYMCKK